MRAVRICSRTKSRLVVQTPRCAFNVCADAPLTHVALALLSRHLRACCMNIGHGGLMTPRDESLSQPPVTTPWSCRISEESVETEG